MPEIRNSIQIDAPIAQVYPLVSSGEGFRKWWGEDVTVRSDGTVDLGFFNRGTIYSVKPVKSSAPSEFQWKCLNGQEWEGTKLVFRLAEKDGGTVLRFTHADWQADTDYFVSCSTTWGALMFRIKAALEGKPRGPLFSKQGWSL